MADDKVTRVGESVDLVAHLASDKVSADIKAALAGATEVKEGDRVIGLVGKDIRADIQLAKTSVEDKAYESEYVALSAITLEGASVLMSGVVDETFKGEGDEKKEVPSVVKYFNQGFGILARNACAARVRVAVEGPDKALTQAAKALARAKGWTGEEGFQKALARIKASYAED